MVAKKRESWRGLYQAALLETDPQKLHQLICEAQAAVQARVRQLLEQSGEHQEEHQALADALQNLRVLLREKTQP